MKNHPLNIIKLTLLTFVLLFGYSCSKDTDLIADYVVETPNTILANSIVTTLSNNPIVIDPLKDEVVVVPENVIITEVTPPTLGTAVVNNDNTITYTPDEDKSGTDEFGYTATVTNPDNSTTTATGNVTVNVGEAEKTPALTGDNIFYVTTSGNSSNSGADESNAWNIEHAFKTAKAGDIIYIKAGNYGALNLSISQSGTSGNEIQFIGYRNQPGDITAVNGSTFKYNESTFSTSDYPTLVGVRSGGNVSGIGIQVKGDYVEIHNFQIKDKKAGINSYGKYNKLNNVIILEMGNYTGYSGTGVIMNGDYSQMTNSFIKNGVQLFTNTKGDNQLIDHNWLGCDQTASNDYSTDYYLMLTGSGGNGADNNTISNNTIYRQPKQYHQAHGLIIKGHGQYNNLINNTLINCPLELSFDQVAHNTITGGSITGTGATGDGGNVKYAFILVANGAHHNTFQDMTITGDTGVRFSDWNDGWTPSPDTDAEDAGHDNLFKNIHFDNLLSGIEFAWHWKGPGAAKNNVFENCKFTNIKQELFRTERPNSGTIMRNCTFTDNTTAIYNQDTKNLSMVAPKGEKKTLNVSYENCTWDNNGFTVPNS